ncbi:MAG TPA: rRNA large subunit methyltransferase I [Deltaproteobacteria bacterium]|nr:MAG: hypothetical protein A2048_03345 [Deltaproteobacteria bacterium GWA2_45_12]HBF13432.1 rRNA large subunit methyltransferase I [Deltaproteobacteria bacterium]
MFPKIKITAKGLSWFQTGHPWVFKSDLADKSDRSDRSDTSDLKPGIVEVVGPKEKFLALALYSPHSKIALRILARKKESINPSWWEHKIQKAISLRNKLPIASNAKRLIFGESDGLPSLIVDQYDQYLVIQTLSAGMEVYKKDIIPSLKNILEPKGILERNDATVRNLEHLPQTVEVLAGEVPEHITIDEGSLKFIVNLRTGQKTGAFLDQRDNRLLAGRLAFGDCLDIFSYQGWFACHMASKAKRITCLDSSLETLAMAKENAKLNGFENKMTFVQANAFDFLRELETKKEYFNTVNLDPPAFVRSIKEKEGGYRGYKEVNLRGMKLLKDEGVFISSSCSHAMERYDFLNMIHQAALDTNAELKILYLMGQAPDHPIHPHASETEYLKCLFAWVEKNK